jgi:hypothetical protein
LNWNKWVRQTHRWLSIAFTVAVIVNFFALMQKKYTGWVGLLALLPVCTCSCYRMPASGTAGDGPTERVATALGSAYESQF